jgi:hypothetical protein
MVINHFAGVSCGFLVLITRISNSPNHIAVVQTVYLTGCSHDLNFRQFHSEQLYTSTILCFRKKNKKTKIEI